MASVTRFVSDTLRLTVNPLKSAVDRPAKRRFPGFTVSRNGARLKVADKAIDKLKDRLADIVAELRIILLGWKAYFAIAEALSPLRDIDKWLRRKFDATSGSNGEGRVIGSYANAMCLREKHGTPAKAHTARGVCPLHRDKEKSTKFIWLQKAIRT